MRYFLYVLIFIAVFLDLRIANAGYPPTTVKVPGDSSGIVTFNTVFVGATGSHSGTTATVNLSGKSSGEVFMTASTSCPTGSITADGSSLLRTGGTSCGGGSCANLFAAISTTYGSADGTHFTLPNMSGVFARGAGTQGSYSATQNSSLNTDTTKKNGLALTDPGHVHSMTLWGNGATGNPPTLIAGGTIAANSGSANTASAATGITLGTGDAETRPANIVLLFCIAY